MLLNGSCRRGRMAFPPLPAQAPAEPRLTDHLLFEATRGRLRQFDQAPGRVLPRRRLLRRSPPRDTGCLFNNEITAGCPICVGGLLAPLQGARTTATGSSPSHLSHTAGRLDAPAAATTARPRQAPDHPISQHAAPTSNSGTHTILGLSPLRSLSSDLRSSSQH